MWANGALGRKLSTLSRCFWASSDSNMTVSHVCMSHYSVARSDFGDTREKMFKISHIKHFSIKIHLKFLLECLLWCIYEQHHFSDSFQNMQYSSLIKDSKIVYSFLPCKWNFTVKLYIT